jgi:hypothetical protein
MYIGSRFILLIVLAKIAKYSGP